MSDDWREALCEYLAEPAPERFLRLRTAVIQAPDYDPYSNELADVPDLLDRGELAAARERLLGALENWVLNPRYHATLAYVQEELGDAPAAELEQGLAALLLHGISLTGDGTEERPYLVSRIADEYDVLGARGKRLRLQGLVRKGDRHLDRLECEDGSEVWFDVTELLARARGLG